MLTYSNRTSFIATEREGIITVRVAGTEVASFPGRLPDRIKTWADSFLSVIGLPHRVTKYSCHTYENHPRLIAFVEK
jgi:hypothetical protein